MRLIPGMTIINPADAVEARAMVEAALLMNGPVYMRFGRFACPIFNDEGYKFEIGKGVVLADGTDVTLLALGNMNGYAAKVRKLLAAQGISCAHVNARFVCPLDADCIMQQAAETRLIVTLEDHVIAGGFGSAVMELLNEQGCATPVLRIGWPNQFIEHGSESQLRSKYGLTPEAMATTILQKLQAK